MTGTFTNDSRSTPIESESQQFTPPPKSRPIEVPQPTGNELPGLVEHLVHDLTQPLSAISNFASACRSLSSRDTPQSREQIGRYCEKISDQVMRAGEMITMMRSLMQRMVLGAAPTSLDKLIRDSLWMIGVSCSQQWNLVGVTEGISMRPAELQWTLWSLLGALSSKEEHWQVSLSDADGSPVLTIQRGPLAGAEEGSVDPLSSTLAERLHKTAESAGVQLLFSHSTSRDKLHLRFPLGVVTMPDKEVDKVVE